MNNVMANCSDFYSNVKDVYADKDVYVHVSFSRSDPGMRNQVDCQL